MIICCKFGQTCQKCISAEENEPPTVKNPPNLYLHVAPRHAKEYMPVSYEFPVISKASRL